MSDQPILLTFDGGTVVLEGEGAETLPNVALDSRTRRYRAEGRHYRALVEHLREHKIAYKDDARVYQPVAWKLTTSRKPFPHQTQALETWWKERGRGVVVLPTGTGKTHVALMAIERAGRPALVVTPTIDLLNQWHGELTAAFGGAIGLLGGGAFDMQPITVTTYDSAYIYLERWGNRYGLIVFDECHHLPGPSFQFAAIGAIAPYRLGLTATPERADGQEMVLPELIGPIVYRREIKQLAGAFLADYQVRRIEVELGADDARRYQEMRAIYRRFLEINRISLGGANGWRNFLMATCRSTEGRQAFQAFREQKRLALAAPAKLDYLEQVLARHAQDRVLIFTFDNLTVYQIARRFLVPAITHQTKTRERKLILERFHSGEYSVVVTSQVLNEGVDIPAANVGVILSGTGSVREHVQRLGRLLRKQPDKQALLYEVVTRGTAEEFTSERRRQHHAYQ